MLTLLTKRNVWYSAPLRITPETWYDRHSVIVNAICARDSELAMRLMGEHIDGARQEYQEHLSALNAASVKSTSDTPASSG